jgi:hypothetical protein
MHSGVATHHSRKAFGVVTENLDVEVDQEGFRVAAGGRIAGLVRELTGAGKHTARTRRNSAGESPVIECAWIVGAS